MTSCSISATIITYREATHIADCIASLQMVCDDIVVLDSNSDDETCAIAAAQGARVFQQTYLGDGPQKNAATTYAQHDWILSIDADERLEADAIAAIQRLELGDPQTAYAFRRRNFVGEHWLRAAGFYPDNKVRLYHRRFAAYTVTQRHDAVVGYRRVVNTKTHLRHLTYDSYAHWMTRITELSVRDAETMYARGKRVSRYAAPIHAFAAFWRKLLLRGGIFKGVDGLTVTMTSTWHTYMKYAICYALQQRQVNKDA